MADESNDGTWYWLKPDRQQMQGSLDELRGLLSTRALPRSTLVWFDPWPEWRSAARVPELADALPPSTGRGQAAPKADRAMFGSAAAAPEAAGPSRDSTAKGPLPTLAMPSQELTRDCLGTFDNIVIRRSMASSDAPTEVSVGARGTAVPPPPSRGVRTALLATSAACVALALGLGLSLRALSSRRSEPAPAARPVAPPSAPPGCALVTAASKLSPSVEREVSPEMIALSGDRVAIGFAAHPKEAAGIVVDLETLDSRSAFGEASERAVVAVTPTADSPVSFAVDREDGALASAAALDSAPRRLVGVNAQGIASRAGSEDATPLWPIAKRPITTPRVARSAPSGFALAFRAGGVGGDIMVGWLDADGHSLGDPQTVEAGAEFVGTPAIESGPGGLLVAFAARSAESEPWRLKLVRATEQRRLERPLEFALPAEDLGAGAIAPALSVLPDNRWLLQWTQGESGKLRVRVQALSAELQPLGVPSVVSPMGANAGQGSLWALGDRTLSLFVLPVPGRDELWGAVLKCR